MRSDHQDLGRTRLDAIARGGSGSHRGNPDPSDGDDRHGGYDPFGDEPFGEDPFGDDEMGDVAAPRGHGTDRWGSVSDRLAAARWEFGRRGVAAVAAVACAAAVVAVAVAWRDRAVPDPVPPLPAVETVAVGPGTATSPVPSGAAPSGAGPTATDGAAAGLVVSVVGLVARPGLVDLPAGSRVADALDAAGGTLDGADLLALNLAQRVTDGDQIVVGVLPPEPVPVASGVSTGSGPATGPGAERAAGGPGAPLDLNACDEAALDALPGVGPVTAAAIVEWRRVNGPFTDVEQLAEVDGIGPARLARLRELVTV